MKRLVLTAALFVGLIAAGRCLWTNPDTADYDAAMAAGMEALSQGRYGEAEKLLLAAVAEAESVGPQDVRLNGSLNSLTVLYRVQGKYAGAEPLFTRSSAIAEKALGPDHPSQRGSPEFVQFVFAWTPGLEINARTTRERKRTPAPKGPHMTRIDFEYVITIEKVDSGLAVHFKNLNLGKGLGEREEFPAILEFAGMVPNFVVSNRGEFIRVHDAAAVVSKFRGLLDSAIPERRRNPALAATLSSRIASEQLGCTGPPRTFSLLCKLLTACALDQWEPIVGGALSDPDLDLELELGATYEHEGRNPFATPSVELFSSETVSKRLPCIEGESTPKCVELIIKSHEGPIRSSAWISQTLGADWFKHGLLFDEPVPDSFLRGAAVSPPGEENALLPEEMSIEVETRLVTEPDTMLPHLFEKQETIRWKRAGGTKIEERIDIQKTTYTYDSK